MVGVLWFLMLCRSGRYEWWWVCLGIVCLVLLFKGSFVYWEVLLWIGVLEKGCGSGL
jgi:hypothetical protein